VTPVRSLFSTPLFFCTSSTRLFSASPTGGRHVERVAGVVHLGGRGGGPTLKFDWRRPPGASRGAARRGVFPVVGAPTRRAHRAPRLRLRVDRATCPPLSPRATPAAAVPRPPRGPRLHRFLSLRGPCPPRPHTLGSPRAAGHVRLSAIPPRTSLRGVGQRHPVAVLQCGRVPRAGALWCWTPAYRLDQGHSGGARRRCDAATVISFASPVAADASRLPRKTLVADTGTTRRAGRRPLFRRAAATTTAAPASSLRLPLSNDRDARCAGPPP